MSTVEVNHVGLTVTDIDAAVEWYARVFGLTPVFGPVEVRGPGRSKAVFGPAFGAMKRAVLRSANGAGVELFEFIEPATVRADDPFRYWETGPFHVCFTCSDVADQLATVADAGGRARTEPLDAGDGRRIAYCEDPFGNVLELTDRSLSDTYAEPR